ncbi:putative F-box/LRR-repeat protein At4g15060, partial [Beta vulgaris subsp. vulgaris]|uniref:putative F-box/LRR-repeat protein At4g15060 n=1 Tax=Beta vulgaris subsp. vulgaris TaxID=3555 RepID=UPI002036C657
MIQSKHLKKPFNLETANRINELPDKLLCHILAFLPTRCAVATSILSKRWMYVWTDVPVLDFMDLPSSMTSSDINFNEIQFVRFKNYVNRFLLLNGSPCLERVHFEAYKGFLPIHVYEWMLVIARRCVLELCVISKHFSVKIPSNFFVDKEKLTVLKLEGPFELDMLASFDLPCLQILSLSEVVFLNKDDPLSSILSSSEVLKELNIDRCKGLKEISVSSSSLKTLR